MGQVAAQERSFCQEGKRESEPVEEELLIYLHRPHPTQVRTFGLTACSTLHSQAAGKPRVRQRGGRAVTPPPIKMGSHHII